MTWPYPLLSRTVVTAVALPPARLTTTPDEYPAVPGTPAPVATQAEADPHATPYRYSVPVTTVVLPALPSTSVPTTPCCLLFSPATAQLPTDEQSMPLAYQAPGIVTAVPGTPFAIGTIDA